MYQDEDVRAELLVRCRQLRMFGELGEHAEELCSGLDDIGAACARVYLCRKAFEDCYSERIAGQAVADVLPSLKEACEAMRVLLLGKDSEPLWRDVPLAQRDLHRGALLCTMSADRWRGIGRLWQRKRGDGARMKRWMQSLLTFWGAKQGVGKERQAEILIGEFPEYSSVESLCTALKQAAQLEIDAESLEMTGHLLEGIERAEKLYVPQDTDWFRWVCGGFVVTPA